MGATAAVTITCTASGLPEGGVDQISYTMTNTSAANTVQLFEVATASAAANTVTAPSSARVLMALPPSTNTFSYRVRGVNSSDDGMVLSSQGMLVVPVIGGNTYVFYTTQGTTFTIRVLTY